VDFQTFHPDLLWLTSRHPRLQVQMDRTSVSGQLHEIHLNLKIQWDPPLGRGGPQVAQLDLLRCKDL
jgi:hypothetical protein